MPVVLILSISRLILEYKGLTTEILCPVEDNCCGRAPETSANPPALEKGATSADIKIMFIISGKNYKMRVADNEWELSYIKVNYTDMNSENST